MSDPVEPTPVEIVELNADSQEVLTLQSLCMKCMHNVRTVLYHIAPHLFLAAYTTSIDLTAYFCDRIVTLDVHRFPLSS
jgi:hypothetical protein